MQMSASAQVSQLFKVSKDPLTHSHSHLYNSVYREVSCSIFPKTQRQYVPMQNKIKAYTFLKKRWHALLTELL